MKKIGIVGHFALGKKMLDGQTIKTKVFAEELKKQLGEDKIVCVDTHGGLKSLFRIVLSIPLLLKQCTDVIMLPAHNGLLVITPVLSFFNKFARKKLHYVVIGGWLAEYLDKHRITAKLLKKSFFGIYVETSVMKNHMESRGFKNIFIFPNYKNIEPVSAQEIAFVKEFPVKTCTFSRITPKKGIEDAVKAVCDINLAAKKNLLCLDIYGSVDDSYKAEFDALIKNTPEYIRYSGEVDFDRTISVLKNYAFQIFPTKFKTEGIPGSVIEGFFAGLPVIASRWNSFGDLVDEGITGIGFEIESYDELKNAVEVLVQDFEKINEMKKNCIDKANQYKSVCLKSVREYFLSGVDMDVVIKK